MTEAIAERQTDGVEGLPKDPKNHRFWRQLDLMPPSRLQEFEFLVIGAGAIGGETVLKLARMGATRFQVWDGDRIDEWNVSNQVLYPVSWVGRPKVECLAHYIKELTEVEIQAHNQMIGKGEDQAMPVVGPKTILIAAVDSMDVRKVIWEELAKDNPSVRLFIDPRMGAEVYRQYSINPVDPDWQKFYEENCYTSEKAVEAPCTERSIIYTPSFASGFITSVVKKFIMGPGKTGKPWKKEIVFDCADFITMTEDEIPE